MKRTLLIAVACAFMASPAMADLFNFEFGVLQTSYSTSTQEFVAEVRDQITTGQVVRVDSSPAKAAFDSNWGPGDGNFVLALNISNITPTTADGDGEFIITGTDFDTISGIVDGQWTRGVPGIDVPTFRGVLAEVVFVDDPGEPLKDGNFDGDDLTFVPMDFSTPQPWEGMLIDLTASKLWFSSSWTDKLGGSVDAVVVPLPGAVLLGFLGLAAAGIKLRRAV